MVYPSFSAGAFVDVPHIYRGDETVFPELSRDDITEITIRPARAGDVHGMSALINHYASQNVMLARGPQYLFQHLQDYIVATCLVESLGRHCVVGCAALNVLWGDLAEVRSLAVHSSCQHRGLGRDIVAHLVERCRGLDIPKVFCFTLMDTFFRSCGFKDYSRDLLPPIVWAECSKCPKFYHCDEISMIYEVIP